MARRNLTLPSDVTILGQKFKIEDKKLSEDTFGETCGMTSRISVDLDKHSSQELLNSTLLHEIIHGVLYVSGQSQTLSEQQEEGLVVCLENGLKSIIRLTFK